MTFGTPQVWARPTILILTAILTLLAARGAWAAPLGQADALIAEIQRQVAQVRGLEVRSETPVVLLPRTDLVQRLAREVNTDKAVREFLTSQMLLEVLGVTKRGYDLRQLQLQLLEEQTLAVYDYQDRAVYVAAEAFEGGDFDVNGRLVLAHELTHALQDQHFNLRRVVPAEPENSDVAMAVQALVEGDAMLTMRIWGRQHLRPNDKRNLGNETTPTDPVLDAAPPLVQGETLFPYDAGWVFAQLLYQEGGFDALNQAFARPPRSTEQILHPEKYQAGENPVSVTIAPLEQGLGGTWTTLRTDVFGELVLRLLLEPVLGWPVAEGAASGWGGDAYTILEDANGRRIVGLVTVWDTEPDAAEWFNAFSNGILEQYAGSQRRTLAQPGVNRWRIPEYSVQALKTGSTVRIVYAPDEAMLDLADDLLSGARIGPSGPVAPPPTAPPDPVVPEPVRATPTPRPATPEPATDDEGDPEPGAQVTPTVTGTPMPSDGTPRPAATPSATPAAGDDNEDDGEPSEENEP